METVQIRKTSKLIMILNVFGGVMMVFALFNIYTSYKYISGLVVQGFVPSKQMAQVANYYMTSVTPYAFYGICLFALAYIAKRVDCLIVDGNKTEVNKIYEDRVIEIEQEEDDDIVETLLNEIDGKE